MKIGIDVSAIIYGTGVSIYTRELVKHLLEIDKKNTYVLFGGSFRQISNIKYQISKFGGNFERSVWPIPPLAADIFWNRFRFPSIETLIGRVDVFHSSDWTQPPTNAFAVTTVHDLTPIRFPKETHPRIVAVHKRRLELVKKEVDRVIVPSLATKMDLVNYGVSGERIRVIPEAPSIIKHKSKETEIESAKKKFGIDSKNYLVTVGVGQRKNTNRLISAFEKVRPGEDLKLVLIGKRTEKYKDQRNLRFTGQVTDEEFASLISGAQALVYPSLYEGFGLPILEAFAAGVPVVTSNTSSLPEVAGEGAILIDPYEVDSIAQGITKALRNKTTLAEKGLKQAKKFSWERAARETLAVYNEEE